MAGHSKWNNIKRKKEKTDSQKTKIFTKISLEMILAIKEGGPNPANNSRLRDLIAKAKQNNVPNDNIERAIKKATGDKDKNNYEEIIYEGYATSGVAVIVEALTNNRNRTASEVRHLFDKYDGNLGTTGCVSYMFSKKGIIIIEKTTNLSFDDILNISIEALAEDCVEIENSYYQIETSVKNFTLVREKFEELNFNIISSEIEYVADNYVKVESQDDIKKITTFIEFLQNNGDILNVWHNGEF